MREKKLFELFSFEKKIEIFEKKTLKCIFGTFSLEIVFERTTRIFSSKS